VLADVYRAALPDPADMTKFDSCEVRQAAHPASLRVFVGERGGRYYRFADHFWSALHRAGPRDSGIGVHTLRHSWATRMVAAGCDLVLLMQLDGWSSLAMVQRYAHPSDRGAQAVATMLAARPGSESPRQSPRAVRELGRTS
jgi:integrase